MVGARKSSPQRVGELLTAAVPGLSERMIEETIRREWAGVVPADLSRRSDPGELRRGTLEVRADNSPWLQELTLRAGELLAALAGRYGRAVTALRFSLGPVRRERAAARPPASSRGREAAARLSPEEAREVEALVAPLADPELATALRRLLTKDRLARRPSHRSPGAGRESA